ncbi:hypothetical protein EVAR_79327_1 [Eumeta japonica]|uniref:Uncharacterized protein n=1 Tax=Eumeta variegata TaxID=151549 RepID=A0A4C1TFS3_EUMVA|nr:hypothetical protein EVAR_79327_1 [Eumeta japonica]
MSPHFNLLKCRRLGTAATSQVQSALVRPPPAPTGRRSVRCAARLPRCGRRGAYPDIVGTIILIGTDASGAPRRSERRRGPERRRGHRLADALSRAPPSSTTTPQPGAPNRRERMRNDARPRVARRRHRIED